MSMHVNRTWRLFSQSVSQSGCCVNLCNTQTDERTRERQIWSFDRPFIDYMKSLFDVGAGVTCSFKTSEISNEFTDSTEDDLKSDATDHHILVSLINDIMCSQTG